MNHKLYVIAQCLLSLQGYAQDGKIETDQPDQSIGAGAVDKRCLQVESSLSTADLKYDVSRSITVFGEYFAQFQVHEHPLHNVDAGILYALSRHIQLHVAAGSSIFSPWATILSIRA